MASSDAHSGRDGVEKRVGEPVDLWRHVLVTKVGAGKADAAIDVIAHSAGGDHSSAGIDRRDAANRKAVAPVNIGHGERVAHDSGKASDIGDLEQGGIVAEILQH